MLKIGLVVADNRLLATGVVGGRSLITVDPIKVVLLDARIVFAPPFLFFENILAKG